MRPLHLLIILWLGFVSCGSPEQEAEISEKPNILFVISDDQSYPHASVYGFEAAQTDGFDRLAKEGILFTQAYAPAPGCSPTRASILTGRNIWEIEQAGTHASTFPQKYICYTTLLEAVGYKVGYTGKPWSPGDWEASGRERNPAGNAFNEHYCVSPRGMSSRDYYRNFRQFLDEKDAEQPFCFWMGGSEAHRVYSEGLALDRGKKQEDADVPPFLPDSPEIRKDILDYAIEIEYFDQHMQRSLDMLEDRGMLENTLVIYTSDNGMPFPRAKANLYEYGIHMPFAAMWKGRISPGRTSEDFISLMDLAPTFLEAAGIYDQVKDTLSYPMTGKSIMPILLREESASADSSRTAVYSGRERHSYSRWNNLTYPMRSLRSGDYLYIRNFKPERWPAGAPQKFDKNGSLEPMHSGYHDIDAGLSLTYLIQNRNNPDVSRYFHLAVDKRPEDELYNVKDDPGCINNLAKKPEYQKILEEYKQQLEAYLTKTEDPRMTGNGDVWEEYPRLKGPMRKFPVPDWAR
jgi:uncharacterized sulfatase